MITCTALNKHFTTQTKEQVTALSDVNLEIQNGDLIILKGPSGSGKSTLLSLLGALAKPSSGEVVIDEQRISKLPEHFAATFRKKNVGFIFQRFNLIPTLSVKDNLLIPLIPDNPQSAHCEEKIAQLLDQMHLGHKANELVRNLSGGEQQRVAIARALVHEPALILADEPTANLDAKLSQEFISLLRSLKDGKRTIIIATHDPLFFDFDIVDKTIEISHGKIVQ